MIPITKASTDVPDPETRQLLQGPPVLWQNLTPKGAGILDLVDDMLARCIDSQVRLVWVGETVTEFPLSGGEPAQFKIKLRKSIFRAILARMAALCDIANSGSVSPYHGRGEFVDQRTPQTRFLVDFMNTPDEQRLELTPLLNK
jgi:hypothetical protein